MTMKFLAFLIGLLIPVCLASVSYAAYCEDYPNLSTMTAQQYYEQGYPAGPFYVPNQGQQTVTRSALLWTEWCSSAPTYWTDGYTTEWYLQLNVLGAYCYAGSAGVTVNGYKVTTTNPQPCDVAPAEPEHCADSIQSGDETGINCGGSCLASCIAYCPDGWVNIANMCYSPETPMINGLCPEGTTGINYTNQTCSNSQAATWANDTYTPDPVDGPSWVFNDQNSPWVSSTTSNVVDNQDGTSTETVTNTTTTNNYDGTETTSTSTTTNIIDNTTGQTVSSTTQGTESFQEVINFGTPQTGDYDGTLVEGTDYPVTSSFSDMLDSFASGVGGVGTALGDSRIEVSDMFCSIELPSYGSISFCGEPYTDIFAKFSVLLVAFAYLSSIYIVFRR